MPRAISLGAAVSPNAGGEAGAGSFSAIASMHSPIPRFRGAAGARAAFPFLHAPATLVLLATGMALAPAAHAATAAPMGEVVVTANRTPQPLADLVADVSIVDRDTIEASGATGLADVLARVPGIEISRNGGPGTTTSVYLRGAEQRFTAVYIDGVRVDSQTTGGAPWEAIPLGLIDRIEVLRGPAAAVYGSDAVGGVIQIFTRKGEGPAQPYVGIGAGSHGTYKAEAGVSGSAGEGRAVDYALGFEREISDGFNARPIAGQNPDKDGLRRSAVNARVGLQIDPRQRLEGTLLGADTNAGYDTTPLGNDDRALHRMHALGLNWRAQWSDRYTTRLSVTDSRERYETRPSPYTADTRLRGYLFQNEWREGRTSSPPRWSGARTACAAGTSMATARRTRWRWATASPPARMRCRSTHAMIRTASSGATTPAASPMAMRSRRNGGPRHRPAPRSAPPRSTSVSALTASRR